MISVLSVNYRSGDDLRMLWKSLRTHHVAGEVELVVTNNSPEERVELAGDSVVPVRVIDSENVGFGAGINIAFRASNGEYVMIANPDVRVTAGACREAVEYLDAHRDVGIVLPLLRYPDGEMQPSVRRFYTWPVVFWARSPFRGVGRPPWFFREYLYEGISLDGPTDVDWGIGGAMFLRRDDFPDGTIFDEQFFLYFEDVDLCLRVWRSGRRVVFCPGITCIHDHRRASRKPISKAGLHHFQSLLKFVLKHRGLPKRP